MVAWLLIGTIVYSWAGEKMPWLSIHMTQPLIFLAALSLAGLLKRSSLDLFTRRNGVLSMAIAAFLAAVVLGGLVAAPPLAGTQLGIQTEQLQRAAMVLLAAAAVVALAVIGIRNGIASVAVPSALAVLAALLVLTIRTGWEVTYNRGDIPRDMLVYVQTSPDVPRVVREIDRIAAQTGAGKDVRILLDGGYTEGGVVHESIAWPFEWYLREYTGKSYFSRTFATPTDAPVILAMVANEGPIRGALENYVPQRGRLNWWYPEDYKKLTWEKIWEGLKDASVRARVWRYFLYRETLNPLGSRDFDFFVRSDLARGISAAGRRVRSQPRAPAAEAVAQTYEGESRSSERPRPEGVSCESRAAWTLGLMGCCTSPTQRPTGSWSSTPMVRLRASGGDRGARTANSTSHGEWRWRPTATSTLPTPGTTASRGSTAPAGSLPSGGPSPTWRERRLRSRAHSGVRGISPSRRMAMCW